MADTNKRDWIDVAAKLLIPIVLAVGGYLFTAHKDKIDAEQQQLERDSGYIKLLVSDNDKERDLGLRIISVLQKEGRFSPDLVPVVQAVAQGRPGDTATQKATQLLTSTGVPVHPDAAPAGAASKPSRPRVYIQIGKEEQRNDAQNLEQLLTAKGYSAPGIELVAHPTFHTYIRYFAADKKDQADEIQQIMKSQGISGQIQDFTNSQTNPSPDLEVWFGADEPVHSSTAPQ